ncbi:biotin/lipoyl-binding protein [Fusobacterium necrophorum]|uniref:Biotin/lipoyl-binding protein n=1 Tax=Fusobacterium necrophorum TaxID=859 RepID=A0A4Q2L456_9FUSO|nr:biotin/lipoyl-containing protein [Fusobacterium necrophorum]RXZ71640.1 biotin/lipoyl-binding protein [Fusobacterium necrophorum]
MKYVVTVNGEKFEVEVERADRRSAGSLSRRPMERGERTSIPVQKPAPAVEEVKAAPVAAPAATTSSGTANAVVSPMPGVILDLKVKEGDTVTVGQTIVILEAMKMENEIVSEFAGKVTAIKVKKGDNVDTDAVLVEIQ